MNQTKCHDKCLTFGRPYKVNDTTRNEGKTSS